MPLDPRFRAIFDTPEGAGLLCRPVLVTGTWR